MKRSLALFLLLSAICVEAFAYDAPRRSNPILRFIAELRIVRDMALGTIINERCSRYMGKAEKNSCIEAVGQKISVLDFDILFEKNKATPVLLDNSIPGSFVFVAFKKDLIRLLSEVKTRDYLEFINHKMVHYIAKKSNETPNLWELTLAYYGNEFDAARVIAILFQDTSPVKLHLAYLEMSGARANSQWFDSNRHSLGETIDNLNSILDNNGEDYQRLFYPKSVQGKIQKSIYHFYVPNYLAMALKRKGTPQKFAFIAPLMLTLTYEFVTAANDLKFILKDPEKISDLWKTSDIYTGYNGSSFGIGSMYRVNSLEKVREAFNVSTKDGVSLLLR